MVVLNLFYETNGCKSLKLSVLIITGISKCSQLFIKQQNFSSSHNKSFMLSVLTKLKKETDRVYSHSIRSSISPAKFPEISRFFSSPQTVTFEKDQPEQQFVHS